MSDWNESTQKILSSNGSQIPLLPEESQSRGYRRITMAAIELRYLAADLPLLRAGLMRCADELERLAEPLRLSAPG